MSLLTRAGSDWARVGARTWRCPLATGSPPVKGSGTWSGILLSQPARAASVAHLVASRRF